MRAAALAALAVTAAACSAPRAVTPPPARTTTTTAPTTTTVPAAQAGWTTYHRDASRDGVDPTSAPPTAVAKAWSVPVDGAVYAEPLVIGGTVVVATESDTVVALRATTGSEEWATHLGDPMAGSQLPCGDIDPSGITGTPVVDQAAATVWVVAFVRPGHHVLFGVDLNSGAVRSSRVVDPPDADPLAEQQRGALALSNGRVYVPFGGLYGDCGNYHGYVLGVDESGSGPVLSYRVPTGNGGGIWSPSGPVVGADGDLYLAIGNGSSTAAFDGSDAVVRLSPDLQALGYMAPDNFASLNASDLDLGSTGPVVLDGGRVFQVGKSGTGYVFEVPAPGSGGDQRRSGPAFSAPVCRAAFGADAFTPEAGGQTLIVVPCTDGLVGLRAGPGATFRSVWTQGGVSPGAPILSGGLIWALDPKAGRLVGIDPASGATRYSINVGTAAPFSTPAALNGRLYVAAAGDVVAFSL